MSKSAIHKVLGLALAAALVLGAVQAAHAQTCTTDLQGPDDEPGQKDLNEFCRGAVTCGGTGFRITYNFDDVQWTGANTGDGCALIDTDGQ